MSKKILVLAMALMMVVGVFACAPVTAPATEEPVATEAVATEATEAPATDAAAPAEGAKTYKAAFAELYSILCPNCISVHCGVVYEVLEMKLWKTT